MIWEIGRIMKKYFKLLGNILMLLSIFFLIIRLSKLNVNYNVIFSSTGTIVFLSFLYGIHNFFIGISWKQLIYVISGKKICFDKTIYVWNKSNMMKYIPGNVFQYVGRNEIAVTEKLNHADVALATILDVLINLIGVFFAVGLSYFKSIGLGVRLILKNRLYLACVGGAILLGVILIIVFRRQIIPYISKIKILFNKKNILSTCSLIGFYIFLAFYTSAIYLAVLKIVVGADIQGSDYGLIIGAYLLSWMVGFVMPGAPGGIGVRETVLTLVLAPFDSIKMDDILLAIVIYRLINIVGDIIGLAFAFCTHKICDYKRLKTLKEKEVEE